MFIKGYSKICLKKWENAKVCNKWKSLLYSSNWDLVIISRIFSNFVTDRCFWLAFTLRNTSPLRHWLILMPTINIKQNIISMDSLEKAFFLKIIDHILWIELCESNFDLETADVPIFFCLCLLESRIILCFKSKINWKNKYFILNQVA